MYKHHIDTFEYECAPPRQSITEKLQVLPEITLSEITARDHTYEPN